MNTRYKAKIFVLIAIIAGLLFVPNMVYSQPPSPGLPVQPTQELPTVKPPAIPPKPDLRVGLFNIRPDFTDFYPGNPGMSPQSFRLRIQVLNGGGAVTGCEVDVVLSKNRMVSPDDRLLEKIVRTETIPPFDGRRFGEMWINSREYSISDIPAGTYYVCVRVDPRNRVAESDETNNDYCSGAIRIIRSGAGK